MEYYYNNRSSENTNNSNAEETVYFPTGVDYSVYGDMGIKMAQYEEKSEDEAYGGLITEGDGYNAENVSVYKGEVINKPECITVDKYLKKYIGRKVCVGLRKNEYQRFEKCGILEDTGKDFIVLRNKKLLVIELNFVRYINIE